MQERYLGVQEDAADYKGLQNEQHYVHTITPGRFKTTSMTDYKKSYYGKWNAPQMGFYAQRYYRYGSGSKLMGSIQDAALGIPVGAGTDYGATASTRSGSLHEPYPLGRGEGYGWRRYGSRGSVPSLPKGSRVLQERRIARGRSMGVWEDDISGSEDGPTRCGGHGCWWQEAEGDCDGGAALIREIPQELAGSEGGAGNPYAEGRSGGRTVVGEDTDGEDESSIRLLERQRRVQSVRPGEILVRRVPGGEDCPIRRLRRGDDEHPPNEDGTGQVPATPADKGIQCELEPRAGDNNQQRDPGNVVPDGKKRRPRSIKRENDDIQVPRPKRRCAKVAGGQQPAQAATGDATGKDTTEGTATEPNLGELGKQ